MLNKKLRARRRACKTRMRIRATGKVRLSVRRSLKHFYAQLIIHEPLGDKVLVSVSTLDKEIRSTKGVLANNIETATFLGKKLAERALNKNITHVAFDRSGYKYHGRVKALQQAANEAGLLFKNTVTEGSKI